MHRYRKGQTFRPPSAAESAAHADAAESHRRQPAQPQDLAPVGQSVLVKTPEEGIPGRDEETIYWEKCKRCIQRYTADEKEIVETDEEVIVYNLFAAAVAGDEYVATAITECGTRYAMPAQAVVYFVLTEDMGNTTAGEASATISSMWVAADEGYTGSVSGVVVDPGDIFTEATSGAKGKGVLRQGDGRTVIDPLVMTCPT